MAGELSDTVGAPVEPPSLTRLLQVAAEGDAAAGGQVLARCRRRR